MPDERDRKLRAYLSREEAEQAQQEQAQPSTGRFPVLERATQIIPVERPTCPEHRDCEGRIRALEIWRAAYEQKWKPLSFVIAAAVGGLITGGIAFALSQIGK
jgi:hypothetical protein